MRRVRPLWGAGRILDPFKARQAGEPLSERAGRRLRVRAKGQGSDQHLRAEPDDEPE
jgi:hypothetical protein